MFILEGPYISDFIEDTLIRNRFKVIDTPFIKTRAKYFDFNLISESEAIHQLENNNDSLYSNSENAIDWVEQHLQLTKYPAFISLFKDKTKFREVISSLYPEFYNKKVQFNALQNLDVHTIPFPIVLKPAVGFFSLGVYTIDSPDEWDTVLEKLTNELQSIQKLYPKSVVNTETFLIESYIKGKEYAVDCYFNETGEAVILNILEHQFSSNKDVSDRLYFTSQEIIYKLHTKTLQFLNELSELTQLKNFPLHLEMRVTADGSIIPIEGNPMRFGGWCTTADLAFYAFGFNAYEMYQQQQKPDWNAIFNKMNDDLFSLIILDNSTGFKAEAIKSFDYERLLASFEKPLELRKVDINEYPLFGYLYTQTPKNKFDELAGMLHNTLEDYIKLK